ncbi:AMP-binding protein [Streptomyces niveiscabiei]|uniref:AMP-binding protein n=1 Tax=Streptomyces niveiscabiei TaxID=164115 RepID=UPI0029A70ACF|nr:AMP-binding protein [Streptomyces niveiscabiei]MDX3383577.1 AMP-binding protein [Streptomyces niveiscabiei]
MESTERAATTAELVARGWADHRPALWWRDTVLTHHDLAREASTRAALLTALLPPDAPPHLGVLLDNTPEFVHWLSAAALARAAVAGINPTHRGPDLARDILHTDCALLITEPSQLPLLRGLDLPGVRLLVTGTDEYGALLGQFTATALHRGAAEPTDRLLLYFTSGSTGAPKAAICTQGRLAAAGHRLAEQFAVEEDDVHYLCMPMFHGNAVMAGWAPALTARAGIALRSRFSASGFLDDVRRYRATYFTYVGRAIQYVLATPPRPDEDRDHRLRLGFGTEAGAVDAAAFQLRFGTRLVEGYGSSEGGAAIQWAPGTPAGAVGPAVPGLVVRDPQTHAECPPAVFGPTGELLNGTEAIGELVNHGPNPFEGYWRNPAAEAERRRDGAYWTGDLFYRDGNGYLYFAGRGDDRIRVDGENLAAALIESILARYDGADAVAVYAVPDPVTGDQVMAAIAGRFEPESFAAFLSAQPDLGTKMAPRFVRVLERMPVTATNKIQRARLRREGVECGDPVWERVPGEGAYRRATGTTGGTTSTAGHAEGPFAGAKGPSDVRRQGLEPRTR